MNMFTTPSYFLSCSPDFAVCVQLSIIKRIRTLSNASLNLNLVFEKSLDIARTLVDEVVLSILLNSVI